ncbi:MAG: general secretion pathway protein GspL [Betaproteobacteria bacterium]|nr:general secretion pathway protein GspL [Betaproteobacteria bacterium]
MSTLILTLPNATADAADGYHYVLTPDGLSVGDSGRASLALLPAASELVALVPVHKLSWHQVKLPKGSLGRGIFRDGGPARLRAVLDGVLEDRVLDDTAELHFALEPATSDDAPVWVAVCDRGWLKTAVEILERSGRPVSRIVPEFAPDASRDLLHVLGTPGEAHCVAVKSTGVVVWPLSAVGLALLDWPEYQPVVAEPAVVAQAEALLQHAVTVQSVALRRVQSAQSAWDLAQFELLNSSGARSWKRVADAALRLAWSPRWRAVRLALLALVVINLAGLNAWAWREQTALQAQRQNIRDILTGTFPQVQVVVDAPLQMGRELAALQRASGQASGRDLEAMLSAFGAQAPANAVPDALDFAAGELRLKGLKLTTDEVSALSLRLKPQGYVAAAESGTVLMRSGGER